MDFAKQGRREKKVVHKSVWVVVSKNIKETNSKALINLISCPKIFTITNLYFTNRLRDFSTEILT